MPPTLKKNEMVVSGININVFSYVDIFERGRPVVILFLLHGRQGSAGGLEHLVGEILETISSLGVSDKDLVVVTFVTPSSCFSLLG